MSITTETAVQTRAERHRARREAQGQQQVQIWLDTQLRELVDQQVKAKGFRNRSEFISSLLATNLEQAAM